jgi:hypothetical protein
VIFLTAGDSFFAAALSGLLRQLALCAGDPTPSIRDSPASRSVRFAFAAEGPVRAGSTLSCRRNNFASRFSVAAQGTRPGTPCSFCRVSSCLAEDFCLPPVFSVVAFDLCSSMLLQVGFAPSGLVLELPDPRLEFF